ncbi:armadillo-type protein [Lasiosphaeris hirsuta]|uniref:Armadillo-type protein n=1 Tax=Lasiosphaeris hirsuta TaxID=260670 RepID=A0AA40DLW2_9PEZI|nr:armadillo-type protein [Lasiosphaeris hirsuta]
MDELRPTISSLVTDQYGPYVIQHVLIHGGSKDRSEIVNIVMQRIHEFSSHKYASNVVERCIETSPRDDLWHFIEELSAPRDGIDCLLPHLIKSLYGNYVIQKTYPVPRRPRQGLLR